MKKGQSASEYLATYGWALIIIFFIVAYLVSSGIFLPSRFVFEECNFQPDLPCKRFYTTSHAGSNSINLAFELTNGMGFPIIIKSCSAQLMEGGSGRKTGDCDNIYLNQGESAFFIINNINSYKKIQPKSLEKIFVEVNFISCKGLDSQSCKNKNETIYVSQGKIISQVLEGDTFSFASFAECVGGAQKCLGSQIQGCEFDAKKQKFVWKTIKICIPPEECEQIGNPPYTGARCMDSRIRSNDSSNICAIGSLKCDGNILKECTKNGWETKMNCSLIGASCRVINGLPKCDESFSPDIPKDFVPPDVNFSPPQDLDDFSCNNSGDTKCFSTKPEVIYQCRINPKTGVLQYMELASCFTQCEQIQPNYAQCAICKENERQCTGIFTYSVCEKNNYGVLEWKQQRCLLARTKCLNNQCTYDNRPKCDHGLFACGASPNENKVYRCVDGQWQEFIECPNTLCYKDQCRQAYPGEEDECTPIGVRRCTPNYLSVEECRGYKWVKIENCNQDTYCSVTGQGDAECVR